MDSNQYAMIKHTIADFVSQYPDGIVIVRGATATGKTALSVQIAEDFPIEIISADSRQFFRGMDIGTDKISPHIREQIVHHHIDSIDPDVHYTAGEWKVATELCIASIQKRGNIPVIVGGTGLYIDTLYKNFSMPDIQANYTLRSKLQQQEQENPGSLWALLYTLDPVEAQKHHRHSIRYIIRALEIYYQSGKTKTESFTSNPPKRPILMLGLWRTKEDSNERIAKRIYEMFDEGLVAEVEGLLAQGYDPSLQSMQGIGYKEVIAYIQGQIDLEACQQLIIQHTQQLAKKQRTWFRRYIADSKTNKDPRIVFCIVDHPPL